MRYAERQVGGEAQVGEGEGVRVGRVGEGGGGQGQGRRGSLGLGGRQEKRTLGAPGGADVRVHSAHAHVGAGAPGVEDSPQAEEASLLAVVVGVGPALVLVRVVVLEGREGE